jgi:hypothetical protein
VPHFTLQLLAPSNLPLVTAFVGVSAARRAALLAASQPVPNLVQIRALVDTGASGTCIDPSVLKTLSLAPTGNTSVITPSTGNQPHNADLYDVSFLIPGSLPTHVPFSIPNLPVMCAELLVPQGFHGLIGRDILSRCLFAYNGSTNSFTLAY